MVIDVTCMASPLQGGFAVLRHRGLCCNSLEWNDHCASLRLALHCKNRTLRPAQLPDLGLTNPRENAIHQVEGGAPAVN